MIKSNIKVLLAMKEMTQTQLSNLTGIRPATITSMIHNTCKLIPIHALNKMCEVLDCNVGDLFTYVEPTNDNQKEAK